MEPRKARAQLPLHKGGKSLPWKLSNPSLDSGHLNPNSNASKVKTACLTEEQNEMCQHCAAFLEFSLRILSLITWITGPHWAPRLQEDRALRFPPRQLASHRGKGKPGMKGGRVWYKQENDKAEKTQGSVGPRNRVPPLLSQSYYKAESSLVPFLWTFDSFSYMIGLVAFQSF